MIKVCVVGLGVSGRLFHVPFILSQSDAFSLEYVVTSQAARPGFLPPGVKLLSSFEQLLELSPKDQVHLVVLCSPAFLHYQQAKQLLTSGFHVLVEKPFASSSKEAQELIDLARSKGRIVAPFHNRRFDGDFITVAQLIRNPIDRSPGTLGQVLTFESRWDRFRKPSGKSASASWKEADLPAGGNLYSLGSHMIDQALMLFGIPDMVSADLRIQQSGGSVNDYFNVDLIYVEHTKLKVSIIGSTTSRIPGPRWTIHGTAGSFVKHGVDPQEDQLRLGISPLNKTAFGAEDPKYWGDLVVDDLLGSKLTVKGKVETAKGCYAELYRNLGATIRGEEPLIVTPEHARNTIRIIEVAIASSEAGRALPVSTKF